MREIQKFLLIDVEYESRTCFDSFTNLILQQAVPNLYLLDLKQLAAIPELKSVNQPTTIEEKFQLIAQYMDMIVVKDAQNAGKPKKPAATKSAVQFGEDAIKSDKYILLLANFQFGEELVLQYNDQQQKNHQSYMQLLQQFITKLNDKVSFEADNNYVPTKPMGTVDPDAPKPPEFKDFDSFPRYPQQQPIYEQFSLLQRKCGIAISAYITLTEDFDVNQLIKSQEGFDEFLNRTNFEPKKTDMYDMKLFQYTYNHYKHFNEHLPEPQLFQTVLPVEEKKRRNVRVQRDPSVAQLCNNDGSVNYTKLANFMRDNSYLQNPDENVDVVTIPTWNCSGFSVYQKVADDVFPQYKAKPPKDEKALQQFMKDSLGKLDFSPQLQKFVFALNKFLQAPILYQKLTKPAMPIGRGTYEEMREVEAEFRDFRHIVYFDVDKAAVEGQEGFPPLLELTKPVKGQPERCGVRAQIGFFSDALNVLDMWGDAEKRVDLEAENVQKDVFRRLKTLFKTEDTFNLDVYKQSLDVLQYEDQNRVSCVIEAMIRQLEVLHPSLAPEAEVQDQKRPPSGQAARPKSAVKKEPPGKKDKNAVEEPKIPLSSNQILELKPQEAEILMNNLVYDAQKLVDPDLNDLLRNYGFPDLKVEKTLAFEKKETETVEGAPESQEKQNTEQEKPKKAKLIEVDKFLAAALAMECRAAVYPAELLKKIVSKREENNQIKLEAANKENERLKRIDFVEQYEKYKQDKAAFERDQKMAKLKAAKGKKGVAEEKPENFPNFQYTPKFTRAVADLEPVPLNAKLMMRLNALVLDFCGENHADPTCVSGQIGALFEQLDICGPDGDAVDGIVRVALGPALLPRGDLYVRSRLSPEALCQAVPRFAQFCHNRAVRAALATSLPLERISLKKYFFRAKFPQERHRLALYDQPCFPREDELVDITEGPTSLVKIAEIGQADALAVVTAAFGTVGCQLTREPEKDDSVEKYEETLKQIENSKKTEEELQKEEEERQKAAAEAAKAAELAEKKSPARAKSSGRKREEADAGNTESNEKIEELILIDADFDAWHFNKFFEVNFLKCTNKVPGFDNEAKIPLDLSNFGDFEAEVPSIAVERDFQPADIKMASKVQFNELGINVITTDPSNFRVRHLIINSHLGPLKLSFSARNIKEEVIQPEIAETSENDLHSENEIEEPHQSGYFILQSKAGSAAAQQTAELRKRKKKLTEFIEACNKERERRSKITAEYLQRQVYVNKPEKSKLRMQIPTFGTEINFIAETGAEKMALETGATKLEVCANQTIKLVQEYRNAIVRDLSLDPEAQFHQLLKLFRNHIGELSKQKIAELQLTEDIQIDQYIAKAIYKVNPEDELQTVELVNFKAAEFMESHKEALAKVSVIPNYGTKVLQDEDLFLAQTFNHLHTEMSREQLSQIDLEKLIPISESRALRQMAATSSFYYGEFSGLSDNAGVILDKFDDERFQFNNFIQALFDNRQNYPSKHFKAVQAHLAAAQPRRLLALPSGVALAEVEGGVVKIVYSGGPLCALGSVRTDGTIELTCNDQLRLRQVGASVVLNGIYTYNLNLSQIVNVFDVGRPVSECAIRANAPLDFLPDVYQLMCRSEKLPRSMWKFLLQKPRPQRFAYTVAQELYARFGRGTYGLVLLAADEEATRVTAATPGRVDAFLTDFALAMKSVRALVPQAALPGNFDRLHFHRMKLQAPFQVDPGIPKSFDEILESLKDTVQKKERPIKHWVVEEPKDDNRPLMKLLYYDKNAYGCYWDTPEGQKFMAEDLSNYQTILQSYSDLSEQVLNPANIYKQHGNVSKNMIKQAQKQERKLAVPRVLEKPQFKEPQARKIIFDTEKRMLEVTGLREMQKNLENQMIYESIQSQEALACKNEEYLQFEGKSLRQTKTMKMSGDIYRRFINITPDKVMIKTTIESLENIYKTQLDEINDKRIKLGLQPKAMLNPNNKIVKIYTTLTLKNHGTETANVRLSRINDSIIKYITFPELKGCGLPPGIAHQLVVELWLDLEKLKPDQNIYDAIVIRTEEEVLSIPLTIMFNEEQTIDSSRMDRPMGYNDDNFGPENEEAIELDDMDRDYGDVE